MLEILALCSCACITTCIWCAVAVLTCPRVVNVPPTPRSEDPGICHSSYPLKYSVQNWGENHQDFPQPCPNVPYPVLMCPVGCLSQGYFQPSISSSTSVQPSSGSSSTSNLTRKESRGEKNEEVKVPRDPNYGCEPVSLGLNNSDHDSTASNNPPIPPPRLRRNRLRSILKSKFKKREEAGIKNVSASNSTQQTILNKSDKGSEPESVTTSVRCKSTCCRIEPEPVLNSVPLFKMICKACRLEKQKCKCIGHPIHPLETECNCRIGPTSASEIFKYRRSSNSNVQVTSDLKIASLQDSSDQTLFLCDQSTCICGNDDRRFSQFRKRSKTGLRRIRRK